MNRTLEQIKQLQDMDTRYISMRKKLRGGPLELVQSQQALDTVKAERDAHQAQAKKLASDAANAELEMKRLEDAIAKFKKTLDIVKNKKEFDAITTSVTEHEKMLNVMQETALQLMSDSDTEKKIAAECAAEMREIEGKHVGLSKEIEADAKVINEELAALKVARKEYAATITDRDILEQYEQIVRSHNGLAVAVMSRDGTCQGCFRSLTPNILSAVMSDKITKCSGCGRFLVLEENAIIED